jgi:hypothetical protein
MNEAHAWINTALTSLSMLGLLGMAFHVGRYTERVNTMWQSFLTRSVAEGVKHGMLEVHSPVRLVNDSGKKLESMAPELRELYRQNKKATEQDLSLLIQRQYGARLLQDICLPNDIPYGVCLIVAVSVAKGEQSLTQILDDQHIPKKKAESPNLLSDGNQS